MRLIVAIVAIAITANPLSAEVVGSSANGFQVRHSVNLVIPPSQAYAAFAQVGRWWDSSHTYSGKASNLSLTPRAGGCFCETLPSGGGVEHLRVAVAMPGERLVLTGGLGPVLYEAAAGVMDVRFEKIAGGTRVVMDYRAAGFANGGAERMAPLVDGVLGQQMKGYRAFAVLGPPRR
jgi:uncharacterized protein YndB with AHSA1/START domain